MTLPVIAMRETRSYQPEQWLADHGDALFAFARHKVRDDGLAEELVQDTLVTALERIDSFAGRSKIRTWLIGILRLKILQHWKRSRSEQSLEALQEGHTDETFDAKGKWAHSPRSWPADSADREEIVTGIEQCLEKLPRAMAEAFLLVERNEMPADEVCKELGVTRTNLYVMLFRARTALRACLEKRFNPGDLK